MLMSRADLQAFSSYSWGCRVRGLKCKADMKSPEYEL